MLKKLLPALTTTLSVPRNVLYILFFISLSNITTANANLLITPTRVELGNRDRSTTVSLVNTSSKTKTYKIFWSEKYQTPEGDYKVFTPTTDKTYPIASNMIRYSPKQVTLAPGERQHVRMAARKPKNLADGEYRSHLIFEAVPNIAELEKKRVNKTGIELFVNLAFSIPVIIYQGTKTVDVSLNKLELLNEVKEGQNFLSAKIHINRHGLYGAVGNINLFWTDKNTKIEKQIGILNNVNIYREVNTRIVKVGLKNHAVKDGTLRVEYKGTESLKGSELINEVINVSVSDYIQR